MASPSAQYSLTIRVEIDNKPGMLGRVATAIGGAGGMIGAVDLVELEDDKLSATSRSTPPGQEHWGAITEALDALEGVRVVDTTDRTFLMHVGGKIEQRNKQPLQARATTSRWPTRRASRASAPRSPRTRDKAFQYTIKRNTVAVVTDGTAVLGLGDIGPRGRDARDGGQGDAVQGVRRRRRVPDLPGHQGPRRDRRDGQAASPRASAASTSRTSPRRAASRSRSG